MTQETSQWLNTMTLIGFTDKRGNAWHYRAEDQGAEPNHYPGAIPVNDVTRRLFNFKFLEQPVFTIDAHGQLFQIDNRKAIVRDDMQHSVGEFRDGYAPHDYEQWLLDNVATIVNGELGIGSAGLLKKGAVAWVQVETPENMRTRHDVVFRPFILATTAHDGSLATTYKTGATVVVCDNTHEAALRARDGEMVKVKHTRNSVFRVRNIQEALGMIYETVEAAQAGFDLLCETAVTPHQWRQFLDAFIPIPEQAGRGKTIAAKKRDEIDALYMADPRASTWNGTAFGALQAVNTYSQHKATIRGAANRSERNMESTLNGRLAAVDMSALETLNKVLQAA